MSNAFWLYDIEYDNNKLLEQKICQYWNLCSYFIMMGYTLTYALVWQKENPIINSEQIIILIILTCAGLFVFFALILILIFHKYNVKLGLKNVQNIA